jgi:hypothetical protein
MASVVMLGGGMSPAMADIKLSAARMSASACICGSEGGHGGVLVFEEHSVAGVGVPSVVDVGLVAAVVIPSIADVETTGCVRSPRLAD